MGLKWFRARLTINQKRKKSANIPNGAGFYRPMSQFDTNVQPVEFSFSQETRTNRNIHPVAASPETIAHNPMAGLNDKKTATSEVPRDIVSRPREQLEMRNDEESKAKNELESTDVDVPIHLPRESIDLMRDSDAEGTFHRIGSRSRKIDFKRKKARAPIPKMTNSSAEASERFIRLGKSRRSDASEIEI